MAERARITTSAELRSFDGHYEELELVRSAAPARPVGPDQIALDDDAWAARLQELAAIVPVVPEGRAAGTAMQPGLFRVGVPSAVREDADGFSVTAVVATTPDSIRLATVTWAKRPFVEWWEETAKGLPLESPVVAAELSGISPDVPATPCADDTWTPITQPWAPVARANHSAIWTGSEMVVWRLTGDSFSTSYLDTGARYNPATDTWTPISTRRSRR